MREPEYALIVPRSRACVYKLNSARTRGTCLCACRGLVFVEDLRSWECARTWYPHHTHTGVSTLTLAPTYMRLTQVHTHSVVHIERPSRIPRAIKPGLQHRARDRIGDRKSERCFLNLFYIHNYKYFSKLILLQNLVFRNFSCMGRWWKDVTVERCRNTRGPCVGELSLLPLVMALGFSV